MSCIGVEAGEACGGVGGGRFAVSRLSNNSDVEQSCQSYAKRVVLWNVTVL